MLFRSQNNLILKAFYTDELNNEDLDSEMHSIKVAKHILDELRVKISDKVDAINDTTKTKEE